MEQHTETVPVQSGILFPKPFTAEQVSETLFSYAANMTKRRPLYGVFDGDALVHWSTGRKAAERWADARELHSQRIA